MLRVRNQRASKARSPYAAVPNGTNTVASRSVLARGRRGNRRGGQVRQPVPPTQATPPTPAAPTTPATQASTEAGQGMSRSGMIGMIPHNMPPIVNPTPDAPSALSSHVPMNQVVKIPTVGSYSRQFSMSNSCSILGDYSSTIDQLLEASISENSSKVYKQGIQAFFNFRVQASFEHLWPPPIDHILIGAYMRLNQWCYVRYTGVVLCEIHTGGAYVGPTRWCLCETHTVVCIIPPQTRLACTEDPVNSGLVSVCINQSARIYRASPKMPHF
nr:uncharacterized protein LOC117689929 [Crassostrea gigas]